MTNAPARSTSRHAPWLALPAVLFLWLALASTASAATYAVDACQRPDGTSTGSEAWAAEVSGSFLLTSDNCLSGGGMNAIFDPGVAHNSDDGASWRFVAAPGTTLERLTAVRTARVGSSQLNGTPETFVQTNTDYVERCASTTACTALNGALDLPLSNAAWLLFGVRCVGGPGGRCPAGNTSTSLEQLRVMVRDEEAPTFTSQPSGSLTSTASTARVRSLTYAAADIGGGVFWQRLIVDGSQVAEGPVDTNAGRCVRYSNGNGFSTPAPCRQAVAGNLDFDTSQLTDGTHELEFRLTDATDQNDARKSWTITVDNIAPVVGEISVSGVAREGDVVRCAADVSGQAAQVSRQWVRSAADGTGAEDVPGATAAEYLVTASDVGKKLLCRVTATDGGGTTVKTSSVSTGLFGGNAVVAAKDAGTPTGGAGLGSGNGAAGANGAAGTAGALGAGGLAGAAGAAGAAGGLGALALPPLPTCTKRAVAMNGAATTLTRTYSRSGMSLSGRLTEVTGGKPVVGAALAVMQTVTRAGASKRTQVSATQTRSDGSFTVSVPRGPTRKLQLLDSGCGAVGATITERVRGAIQAKTSTRKIRNKQTARFSGRVLGGYVGRGMPLELQVKVGRSWRDVKAVTSNARGDFRVSYRFLRTFVRYTYRFRVVSRGGSAWPYMSARSAEVRVRVN